MSTQKNYKAHMSQLSLLLIMHKKKEKEPSKRGLVVFFRLINRSCDAEQFICKKKIQEKVEKPR